MKRRVFNAIAVVSAVLFVATAGLWLWSYFALAVARVSPSRAIEISVDRGMASTWWNLPERTAWRISDVAPEGFTKQLSFLQFGIYSYEGGLKDGDWVVVRLPLWTICLILFVLPALAVSRLRREKGNGCCSKCGYDLRATPDRCPECGAVPGKSA